MKDYPGEAFSVRRDNIAFVVFSLDSNEIHHSRTIYNALDFVGDVGGLYDGLRIVAETFVRIFSPLSLSNFLISRLFFVLNT